MDPVLAMGIVPEIEKYFLLVRQSEFKISETTSSDVTILYFTEPVGLV